MRIGTHSRYSINKISLAESRVSIITAIEISREGTFEIKIQFFLATTLLCESVCLLYILCLSVSLYLINVKTAIPIGPKFCTGPHMTP